MKASVLYFSRSGHTAQMAQRILEGMNAVPGVEARAFPLDAIDADFVKESACVVLGTPSYLACMAGAVKTWLDTESGKYALAGKLGGAFATADYVHGGGDMAVQGILTHFMVRGMLVYSGGGSRGKPYIHLGPVAVSDDLAKYEPTFLAYGERMARKALELFGA